ncbi:hypothetical protein EDC94DRAFT_270735 [Helicostylum pulchrum]|nr:hypothetical protein EDC94DRAFT_270735 [Helicostylum pulchrum]
MKQLIIIFLKKKPVKIKRARCTLRVKGHIPMRISWGGHKKLAVGCTSGSVIIWDMVSLLSADNQSKAELECLPHILQSVLALDASVSSICWNGIRDPDRFVVAGFDGHVMVVDTNDPGLHLSLVRLRNIARTGAWVSHWPAVFYSDNDGVARGVMMIENGGNASLKYGYTPGICWDMCASEHHYQIALVTSLGWLRTSNIHQERSRYSLVNAMSVYKLDYSETTGGYRYVDGIGLQASFFFYEFLLCTDTPYFF